MINSFTGQYAFLSNFFPCNFELDELQFQNAEAAFQSQKTESGLQQRTFQYLPPTKAKALGRKVVLREDWEQVKISIMYEVLWAKFTQNPNLARLLLNTNEEELIEGNTWGDTFWGTVDGVGRNELGILLMIIRDNLLAYCGVDRYGELRLALHQTGVGRMRCFGDSMLPVLFSGSMMYFQRQEEYQVGDVVFCMVGGHYIDAHLIRLKSRRRGYLLSNYHGWDNGWTRTIFGRAIQAELNGKIYWDTK